MVLRLARSGMHESIPQSAMEIARVAYLPFDCADSCINKSLLMRNFCGAWDGKLSPLMITALGGEFRSKRAMNSL